MTRAKGRAAAAAAAAPAAAPGAAAGGAAGRGKGKAPPKPPAKDNGMVPDATDLDGLSREQLVAALKEAQTAAAAATAAAATATAAAAAASTLADKATKAAKRKRTGAEGDGDDEKEAALDDDKPQGERRMTLESECDARMGAGYFSGAVARMADAEGRVLVQGQKKLAGAVEAARQRSSTLRKGRLIGWASEVTLPALTAAGTPAPLYENAEVAISAESLRAIARLEAPEAREILLDLARLHDPEVGLGVGAGLACAPTGMAGGRMVSAMTTHTTAAVVEGVRSAMTAGGLAIAVIGGLGHTALAAEVAADATWGVVRVGAAALRDPTAVGASLGYAEALTALRATCARAAARNRAALAAVGLEPLSGATGAQGAPPVASLLAAVLLEGQAEELAGRMVRYADAVRALAPASLPVGAYVQYLLCVFAATDRLVIMPAGRTVAYVTGPFASGSSSSSSSAAAPEPAQTWLRAFALAAGSAVGPMAPTHVVGGPPAHVTALRAAMAAARVKFATYEADSGSPARRVHFGDAPASGRSPGRTPRGGAGGAAAASASAGQAGAPAGVASADGAWAAPPFFAGAFPLGAPPYAPAYAPPPLCTPAMAAGQPLDAAAPTSVDPRRA